MKHNHGQELVMNRVRLTTQNLLARVGLSLFLAFLAAAAFYAAFAPPEAIKNVIGYGGTHLLVAMKRQAPNLLRMYPEDLAREAHYAALVTAQGSFWSIFGATFGGVSALSFVLLSYLFRKKGQVEQKDEFKRGSRLLPPAEHNQAIRAEYGDAPPRELGQAVTLGKEQLLVPEALSYRHFAFVGASGYGKSTAIEELMAQAMAFGHKGLVLDVKGAYYAKFGRPGDRILSLYDKRSEAWDFWHEPLATPEKIAAAMIEETSDHNKFFWKGARALLASLLRQNKDLAGLWTDFNRPLAEIRAKLADANELSRRVVGDNDSEQGDGIVGTTVLDFAFLRDLGYWTRGKKPLSITRWLTDNTDSSWIFVIVNEADIEVTQPLLRVWFDLAVLAALERDDADPKNLHTWLVIDELKSVGKLPSLPQILDKGRKYRTSVVAGFQATTQLRAIYGDHEAENILQGLQNQFFYRMSSAKAAEEASLALGDEEVLQAVDGVSFGVDSTSDRGTISRQYTKKRLVLPDALRNQEILRCYAKLCHHMPTEIHFEPARTPRRNQASLCAYPPAGHTPTAAGAEVKDANAPSRPAAAATPEPGSATDLTAAPVPAAASTAAAKPGRSLEGALSIFEQI